MDSVNRFDTRTTHRLIRAEYLVGLLACLVLFALHAAEVRWLPAIGLFLYIDLIGYLPGAIAYRRSATKRIPKLYHVLYNTTHSLVTQAVVVGLWAWLIGWEWALLAIPIHLFGDRALFGNFLKPFSIDFEPTAHPAFVAFEAVFERVPAHASAASGFDSEVARL